MFAVIGRKSNDLETPPVSPHVREEAEQRGSDRGVMVTAGAHDYTKTLDGDDLLYDMFEM